ncbi:hypothetical protein KSP40_PGU009513 [Platanthera guangdongensis]|uniref:Uncharacterized protein n=1 Tax=Platanthera guangdongensis TaxID=2320717 RepID=A0ABR2MFY8_9ASPA
MSYCEIWATWHVKRNGVLRSQECDGVRWKGTLWWWDRRSGPYFNGVVLLPQLRANAASLTAPNASKPLH